MKILIGYEGAPAGEAALADLKRAGFPARGEATVFTVADVWPSAEEAASPSVVKAFPMWPRFTFRPKRFCRKPMKPLDVGRSGCASFFPAGA
jgi:hypothetical protein